MRKGREAESFEPVMSARGARKAAEFVEFCDAFSIPVVTFTNVKGYKATKCSEANMAKGGGKADICFCQCDDAENQCDYRGSFRKRLPYHEQ